MKRLSKSVNGVGTLQAGSVPVVVAVLSVWLAGCGERDVTTYEVVAEPEAAPAMAANPHAHGGGGMSMDPHAGLSAGRPSLVVAEVPEGWEEHEMSGGMRVASYIVSDAEGNSAQIAVIPMNATHGSELEEVNMWRKNMKLDPVEAADLPGESVEVPVAGATGKLFDYGSEEALLPNDKKGRMIIAVVNDGTVAWYFKMAGEDALVRSQKEPFLQFLADAAFEAPAPVQRAPFAGGMGMGMMGGGDNSVAPGEGDQPNWQVPGQWTEIAHSPFLVAKFELSGSDSGSANVNVSASQGDGGGLLANVNRWRAQLSLGPVDAEGLAPLVSELSLPTGTASVVDFSGEEAENGGKARCLAVVVPVGGTTWFYKLMGDTSVVEREEAALLDFIRSATY